MLAFLKRLIRREDTASQAEDSPLLAAVRSAMADVQAYARSHGGTIDLVSVNAHGDVKVRFKGACAACPMSGITLRLGIEERLKVLAPGVRDVIAV